jgi:predicted RNA-binding protein YlxR (DUF448 family)
VTVGSGTRGQSAVVPDPQGTAPGRGAHLHPTTACYELAVRKKAFGRALRVTGGKATGALDSAAVGEYVARADADVTRDRQEGWSKQLMSTR